MLMDLMLKEVYGEQRRGLDNKKNDHIGKNKPA